MPNYESTYLHEEIIIDYIVTIHYFEYTKDFFFPGESHDFWEFLYVDKGTIEVSAGTKQYKLKKGDIIFHKPMEFHNLWSDGVIAPNLIVIAFQCKSDAMVYFSDKLLTLGDSEHTLLANIIKEAMNVYESPFNDPYLLKLEKKQQIPFASEQFIKLYLELMLLQLIRLHNFNLILNKPYTSKITLTIREKKEKALLNTVIQYLEKNIGSSITYNDVCKDCYVGRSYLQKIFCKYIGGGVMEYYNRLKIEKAKQYIRESSHNFTEISNLLGYASIHYFSRYFKKSTGMTPTEYASSVKAYLQIEEKEEYL